MPEGRSPSAGPWRPSSAARALHWWSERDLQSLANALQDALAQWGAAWGIAGEGARVRCRPAAPQPVAEMRCIALTVGGAAHAWLTMPDDDDAVLLQGLFPAAARCGPLARAVAASCRQDALARVAASLGLECGRASAAPLLPTGSGAVQAEIAPLGARLLVHGNVALRWRKGNGSHDSASADAREPLVEVTAALVNKRLALNVDLQGCRIGVAALQGLQVGDVVRLDHGLANPASVNYGASPLCAAYLGRSGTRKAVELTARAVPASGEVAQ